MREAGRHSSAVYDVQQCNRQNKCAVEPIGNINMANFANADCSEEYDGIGNPHNGNQHVNRPNQLGIFLTLGQTEWQSDHSQHDHEVPAPESERSQTIRNQASLAGTLHNVIAGGKQARAAKRKDHSVRVERSQATKAQVFNT